MPVRFMSRKRLMALGVTGALAMGVLGASGVALADNPGADGGAAQGQPPHSKHNKKELGFRGLKSVIQASGLDRETWKAGFEAGKTPTEILTENGLDPAAIEAQVLAQLDTRLDQAVADGKMSQDEADKVYDRAEKGLEKIMTSAPKQGGGQGNGNHKPGPGIARHGLATAAEVIGIDVQELAAALKGGQTVGEAAAANGVDPQTVIDALVADANARIDQAVADGKVDAAKADQLKEKAARGIEKFVTQGGPKQHGQGQQ